MCCTYTCGLNTCDNDRRPLTSKNNCSLCEKHSTAATGKVRKKAERKKVHTLSREDYLLHQRKLNSQSAERTKTYRKRRKDDIHSIMDETVKRIATKLDTIKDTQHYVIVPNVISDKLTIDDVVRHGEIEPVNFTDATALYARTMQAVQRICACCTYCTTD